MLRGRRRLTMPGRRPIDVSQFSSDKANLKSSLLPKNNNNTALQTLGKLSTINKKLATITAVQENAALESAGTTLASNIVLSSLTSLGTITSGVWNGTAIGDTYISSAATWNTASTDRLKWDGGATGLVAATGRNSLGLVIGTNVQAYSATLAAAAGGTYTGNVVGNLTGNASTATIAAGLKLEDAAINKTIFSQDNTTDKRLEISSYYSGIPGQLTWLRNIGGNIIYIGDLDNGAGAGGPIETFDCESGQYTLAVADSSIYMDNSLVSISGNLEIDTATGNVTAVSGLTASSISCNNDVKGKTITVGISTTLVTSGTATITTTAITQVTAVSLSTSLYSSVKYFIQARNTTTARFQITEIVATRNATTTVVTATPVDTNTGGIACTYAVDISSSTFRLRITPQAASSTVFKIHYTAIP